jgi:hypothetical protein
VVNPLISQALEEQETGLSSNVNPAIRQALEEQSSPSALQTVVGEEPKYAWNPDEKISYEGENPLALTLAGLGKGGANVYKNVANMLGFDSAPSIIGKHGGFDLRMTDTSDEGLLAADKEYSGITDTTAGKVGEFGGELLALAPLGAVGAGAKVAGAATKLPTAMRILGSMGEGAIGGAILADPGDRVTGGLMGAGVGGLMTGVGSAGSRLVKDGLAKMKKPAAESIDYVTKQTGRRPSLPLSLGADPAAGATSAKTGAIADIMSLLPSAKGAVDKQTRDFATDLYEADLRKAFAFNKVVADRAVKVLKETGDMQKALEAGMGKKGVLPRDARILEYAARMAPEGRYSGKQMLKAAEDFAGDAPLTNAPFRDIAINRMKVLPRADDTPAGQANLFARDTVRDLGSLIGKTVDLVPGVGAFVSTPGFQNFLMGNTGAQRMLQEAMETGTGEAVKKAVAAIRRTMSAQADPNDEMLEEVKSNFPLSLRGN